MIFSPILTARVLCFASPVVRLGLATRSEAGNGFARHETVGPLIKPSSLPSVFMRLNESCGASRIPVSMFAVGAGAKAALCAP